MADDSPLFDDKFTLRMPRGMREKIRAATKVSGRSINGEIIAYISAGLEGGGSVDVDELAEKIVDALVGRLAAPGQSKAPSRGRRAK